MRIVIAIAVLSLTGCASSTYIAQHQPNSKEATVYVIREHAEPLLWNLNVLVDDRKAASLANKSFVSFSIPSGEHIVRFEWPRLAADPRIAANIKFSGGETRYFVVSGTTRLTGFYIVVLVTTETLQVIEVSRADGEKLVRRLKK